MHENKIKSTKNNKKEDGNFKKKNIKHGRKESSRSVFGSRGQKDIDDLYDLDWCLYYPAKIWNQISAGLFYEIGNYFK